MHGRTTVLVALPQPRHAVAAAADVVALHRAPNGAVFPIEGARTCVPTISTGALAVFLCFSASSPAVRGDRAWHGFCGRPDHLPFRQIAVLYFVNLGAHGSLSAGAWLCGGLVDATCLLVAARAWVQIPPPPTSNFSDFIHSAIQVVFFCCTYSGTSKAFTELYGGGADQHHLP
eukprot:COSAG02_NODE_8493_length_2550_cov_9.317478_4_plen_173_part_01